MGEAAEALPPLISSDTMQRLAKARTIEERVEMLVDLALDQHLGDHHIVACELLMATRQHSELARSVLPHVLVAEQAIDARWIEYARELGWSDERMVVFRGLFVAALRGLAFAARRRGRLGLRLQPPAYPILRTRAPPLLTENTEFS